jgi:outer membrane protein assembly factor BamB
VWGGRVYFNTWGSHLYAVDARTGELSWEFQRTGRVYSKPAVADGVLYFGSGDGGLYALDAVSGRELWRFETGEMVCTPAVYDGVVLFGSGAAVYALE